MNNILDVSQLNNQIKSLLETTFTTVYVQGEISNLTYHNSGHIYFSIKDDSSTISCVMFKGNAKYLKFKLELGAKINIFGSLTVYAPRGNYQLLCNKIEPSGAGELALAYEQLKTKLQIKGYFDSSKKKSLPKFPKSIAIVTSNTGAAIQDMKKVLAKRWPIAKMILIPTLVQGQNSAQDIASSIKFASSLDVDFIIVGRGGGSIEDLWAFNEEIVADAIFECDIPIISAVGHESDTLISDFVADIRASTPSNAIEISTPNINDLRFYFDDLSNQYNSAFNKIVQNKNMQLLHLQKSYEQHSLYNKFKFMNEQLIQLSSSFKSLFMQIYSQKDAQIVWLQKSYKSNHPDNKLSYGYVQTVQNNQIIDISKLKKDDIFDCQNSQTSIKCKILSKNYFNL
jgi:exodeoxyribonuclease VII large subunit